MNRTSFLLWPLFFVIVIGGVFVVAKFANRTVDNPALTTAAIADGDWLKGNKNASTTIIEYSDFQCPACGAYYPITKQLVEEFGNSIVFSYRHFPLSQIHQNAELAARAAEAAGAQGKFWEMHDLIFEHQKEWSTQKDARELFLQYATSLGLNSAQFEATADAKETKDRIAKDYQGGLSFGVNATPTFFLNGKKIQNPRNYEEFRTLVREAIPR